MLLPLDYNKELLVSFSGSRAVVETAAGITVTFDWYSTVTVSLPSTYQGAVCGLCGNYNDKAQDDLTMPNDKSASDGRELGESWQVALVPGCSSVCQGAWCKACTDSEKKVYEANKYCGIIADKAGPFRDCHSRVDPAPYMEDCVYDVCHYHGHQGSVCDAVKVYAVACQSIGVTIYSWRTESFCREFYLFIYLLVSFFIYEISCFKISLLCFTSFLSPSPHPQQWRVLLTAITACAARVAKPPAQA